MVLWCDHSRESLANAPTCENLTKSAPWRTMTVISSVGKKVGWWKYDHSAMKHRGLRVLRVTESEHKLQEEESATLLSLNWSRANQRPK
ncbi:hypothetical protein J6590_049983 [Homalodisca vitripennis]|nr:hypothetical protein J6590_049983 [Homalodisca vitripennis]